MFGLNTQLKSSGVLGQLRDRASALHPRNPEGVKVESPSPASSGRDGLASVDRCLFCLDHSADQNNIMVENEAFFAWYDNFPSNAWADPK